MTTIPRSCVQCHEGWTCEEHPGVPWPHPLKDDPETECAGPGVPCPSGCMEFDASGAPIVRYSEEGKG